MSEVDIVTVSYNDLRLFHQDISIRDDLVRKIGTAFGDDPDCLGILAVTDVPHMSDLRQRLLPLARELALLPSEQLDAVTDEVSGYQVGWSHGKERLEGDDKFDLAKGSFYANPLTDQLCPSNPKGIGRDSYPEFYAPNVWPTESLPDLESAFKEMGNLVCHVGRLVARPCDTYVERKCPGYQKGKLESVLTESMYCKARLLHYFPLTKHPLSSNEHEEATDNYSDWCGWHNDHGSMTGLVPGMYLDEEGNQIPCPDDRAGLYIQSRSGQLVQVRLPVSSLAFQIGETSQIHTGGILQATPHAVRGCTGTAHRSITRESFAVFMEPEVDGDMELPEGKSAVVEGCPVSEHDEGQRECGHESHHDLLPKTTTRATMQLRSLSSRWRPGMTFGEFSKATFATFYEQEKSAAVEE